MPTVTELIRERLESGIELRPSLDELRLSEWSRTFEKHMRRRLIVGAMRYQTFAEKRAGHGYDVIGSIRRRLESYESDGNLEHMVDIANLCMIEFEAPSHRNPTWKSIDDGQHVERR